MKESYYLYLMKKTQPLSKYCHLKKYKQLPLLDVLEYFLLPKYKSCQYFDLT
ncbi:unknown [Prevotella sp. CAG:1320]|nr:unknown [Prevotella sp. CAG:1320]